MSLATFQSPEGLSTLDETHVEPRGEGPDGPSSLPASLRPADPGLPMAPDASFGQLTGSILVVCSGNVVRSPVAATLLRSGLHGSLVTVTSGGVAAVPGRAVVPEILELVPDVLRRELKDVGSQVLTREMVRSADVVVTATRKQRSAVLALVPRALKRTFTLGEFAVFANDLVAHLGASTEEQPDTIQEFVAMIPAVRAARRITEAQYDIPDPLGRPSSAFKRTYTMLESTSAAISSALMTTQSRIRFNGPT